VHAICSAAARRSSWARRGATVRRTWSSRTRSPAASCWRVLRGATRSTPDGGGVQDLLVIRTANAERQGGPGRGDGRSSPSTTSATTTPCSLQQGRIAELDVDELREVLTDAWLWPWREVAGEEGPGRRAVSPPIRPGARRSRCSRRCG
jgi:hypothetical protein